MTVETHKSNPAKLNRKAERIHELLLNDFGMNPDDVLVAVRRGTTETQEIEVEMGRNVGSME